jgi:hypothetical protein
MMACRSGSDIWPQRTISSIRRLQVLQIWPFESRSQTFWQGEEICVIMTGSVATSGVQGESLISLSGSAGVLASKYGFSGFGRSFSALFQRDQYGCEYPSITLDHPF